jgi:tetratricopeptide (TPR) repeat protein
MLNDLADALRTFLWFRGYWDELVRLSTRAYEAMAGLEKWRDAGWRAKDVAWIHYHRAETDRAAAWTARMAEAMEQGSNRRDRAFATRMQGLVARQRGELEEAERLYTEVLEAARNQVSDRNLVSIVLNDLGNVAQKREAYGRAEGYYREALELAEEKGNKESQAYISGNLGLLALDRGRPEEARVWFERGLDLAQEVGRQDLVASAQYGLARVLEEEGRYTEALRRAEEALEIRERLRHRDVESTRKLVARLREKV